MKVRITYFYDSVGSKFCRVDNHNWCVGHETDKNEDVIGELYEECEWSNPDCDWEDAKKCAIARFTRMIADRPPPSEEIEIECPFL